jgi:ketosteroid isomerase-like protein
VERAEALLAAALAGEARAALPRALWDDGRIMRLGEQPAVGRGAFTAAIAAGPASIALRPLGGGVSRAGDLAWTYGDAGWDEGGAAVKGKYVRIWQRRAAGWRILIDEVTGEKPRKARPAETLKPAG